MQNAAAEFFCRSDLYNKLEFCEEVLRWCCYTFKNWKFLTLYIIAEEVKWNFQLKNIKTIMKKKY